jgi:hypothetical protein
MLTMKRVGLAGVAAVMAMVAADGVAQTPQITRPGSVQDSGPMEYWSGMSEQERAGGVLLGKVEVEGEPFLWNPIAIVTICEGQIKNVTNTDTKGNFLIRAVIPANTPTLQQDEKRRLEHEYENCTVHASVTGFDSNTITITHRNLRDDPDVGKLNLKRMESAKGTDLSLTSEKAPAKAQKAFQKAHSDALDQHNDSAESHLKEAVAIDPGFAEAWFELGKLQESHDVAAAAESMKKATEADPQYVPPYLQLAGLAAQQQQWQKVVEYTSRSLELAPGGSAQVFYYDALAKTQLGKLDSAEVSARKSLALDPQHSVMNTEQLLATILVRKGNLVEAREHLDHSLTYVPAGANADMLRRQIAQLDKVIAAKKQ